jgi:hypothetical protein
VEGAGRPNQGGGLKVGSNVRRFSMAWRWVVAQRGAAARTKGGGARPVCGGRRGATWWAGWAGELAWEEWTRWLLGRDKCFSI